MRTSDKSVAESAQLVFAVKSFNPLSSLRLSVVEQTMDSADKAFSDVGRILLDNGSYDGSTDALRQLAEDRGWYFAAYNPADENHTPGRGFNQVVQEVVQSFPRAEVVVHSDDDMFWQPQSSFALASIWSCLPDDIVMLSGLLEPEWPHNTPRESVRLANGSTVLCRDSVSGAAMSFRLSDWTRRVGPALDDFGYDSQLCERARAAGCRVASLDLATHRWGYSTHGNEPTLRRDMKPLDKARWGLE